MSNQSLPWLINVCPPPLLALLIAGINAHEDDDDLCPPQQDAGRTPGLQPGGSGQDGLWKELGV